MSEKLRDINIFKLFLILNPEQCETTVTIKEICLAFVIIKEILE